MPGTHGAWPRHHAELRPMCMQAATPTHTSASLHRMRQQGRAVAACLPCWPLHFTLSPPPPPPPLPFPCATQTTPPPRLQSPRPKPVACILHYPGARGAGPGAGPGAGLASVRRKPHHDAPRELLGPGVRRLSGCPIRGHWGQTGARRRSQEGGWGGASAWLPSRCRCQWRGPPARHHPRARVGCWACWGGLAISQGWVVACQSGWAAPNASAPTHVADDGRTGSRSVLLLSCKRPASAAGGVRLKPLDVPGGPAQPLDVCLCGAGRLQQAVLTHGGLCCCAVLLCAHV